MIQMYFLYPTSANSLSIWVSAPKGSRPCNRPWCMTCPVQHPTSSCTDVTYPITIHADCKSMNLIYQLQCTERNAFYIGETRRSLSDHMNGHRFTTTVLNPDLPVAIHTQSTRSLSKNAGLTVSYTNYLTPPQTTSAANLKLHNNSSSNPNTPPVSTSINPLKFHPHPSST